MEGVFSDVREEILGSGLLQRRRWLEKVSRQRAKPDLEMWAHQAW
jgi:hypothetical protein